MMTPRPRVLLADHHPVFAIGLKSILAEEFDVVAVVGDGRTMVDAANELRPDLIVTGISIPVLNGLEALAILGRQGLAIPVLFLTMHREPAYVRRALENGAAGYVLKEATPSELVDAVRTVLDGGTFVSPAVASEVWGPNDIDPAWGLTLRQREVLRLLAAGFSAKRIAGALEISPRTVEFHKYRLMDSLRARSSAELIRFAVSLGIVE